MLLGLWSRDVELWISPCLQLLSCWLKTRLRTASQVETHGFSWENNHCKPCSGFLSPLALLASRHFLLPGTLMIVPLCTCSSVKLHPPKHLAQLLSRIRAWVLALLSSTLHFKRSSRQPHPSQTLQTLSCLQNDHLPLQVHHSCRLLCAFMTSLCSRPSR